MTSNTACAAHRQELSVYADGELDVRPQQALEAHLAACPACTGRLSDLRATSAFVRAELQRQADAANFAGFADRVLSRVKPVRPPLGERLRTGFAEWAAPRRLAFAGGLVAASLALLVGGTVFLRNGTPGPTPVAVQSVSTEDQAHLAPVVLKTADGDAIIWLVEHPDASVPERPVQPARPKGGSL